VKMLCWHLPRTESLPMLYAASAQVAFAGTLTLQNPTKLMMSDLFFFFLVSNGHISCHLFRIKVRTGLAAKTASFKDCS